MAKKDSKKNVLTHTECPADWQSIKVELYEMNMQNIIEEVKQYVDTCKMTKFGASMMRGCM